MPDIDIILIRLLPTEPTDAGKFSGFLDGLTIKAYDQTIIDVDSTNAPTGSGEIPLGSATGSLSFAEGQDWNSILQPLETVPGTTDPPKLKYAILQHVQRKDAGLGIEVGTLKSVATAVIVRKSRKTRKEYPTNSSYDIRLEITRDGIGIDPPSSIEWNATCYTLSELPLLAPVYMGIAANGTNSTLMLPSVYAYIPPPPEGNPADPATLLLNPNGQPPNFDNLLEAVNNALEDFHLTEGTKLENLTKPLTEQQATEIAYELAYNRPLNPLPPSVPAYQADASGKPTIEDLYTTPNDDDKRNQFEGNLKGYHANLDSVARKLTNYIFAASAAIDAERISATTTTMAAMDIPLDPDINAHSPEISVVLTSWDPVVESPTGTEISPNFVVPAAYWYSLGYTFSPSMSSDQRYRAMVNVSSDFLSKTIQSAVDRGIIKSSESTVTLTGTQLPVNTVGAIRRLTALLPNVVPSSQPKIYVTRVSTIVNGWLSNEKVDSTFWSAQFDTSDYLDLLLEVISGGDQNLLKPIKTTPLIFHSLPLPGSWVLVEKASDLPRVTNTAWSSLFTATGPNLPVSSGPFPDLPAPLPNYTAPGSQEDQIKAFVRKLQQIFSVGWDTPSADPATSGDVTVLRSDLTGEFFNTFFNNTSLSLDAAWDEATIVNNLKSYFADEKARHWAYEALQSIWFLYQVTNFLKATPPVTLDSHRRFSYMEALYSRGFTSANSIAMLTVTQFGSALTGTIIEPDDIVIIFKLSSALPNTIGSHPIEPPFGFQPANPGDLVNCIPPDNLSPLGQIQYLHDMLNIEADSNDSVLPTIESAITTRRGDVGSLHATMANLQVETPAIDLVLESLEALGSSDKSISGVVYDTSVDVEAIFEEKIRKGCFKPSELLAAIPEFSSPAISLRQPAVYDLLKTCFTNPELPYSRQLDMSRSYLTFIGTSKYQTMRRFRHQITEFPLNPSTDPPQFTPQIWRFPVRFDIALEYLKISSDEYQTLYSQNLSSNQVAGIYGFSPSESESWTLTAINLEYFLAITGLEYCQLLLLQESCFISFTIGEENTERELKVTANSKEERSPQLPACPPCCLQAWTIDFGDTDIGESLMKVAIFIRLWKSLNKGCKFSISFSTLADICSVLHLFVGNDINPGFMRQLASLLMLHEYFCLPWSRSEHKEHGNTSHGVNRTEILALFDHTNIPPEICGWAEETFLQYVKCYAQKEFLCEERDPEFIKIIQENLGPLSCLAGFTEQKPWNSDPVCAIRFAEVLAKIYASKFSVGQILFMFTVQDHLDGDDPFPIGPKLEQLDRPLSLPDDEYEFNLEKLREKLLCVDISDEKCKKYGWFELEAIIRNAGYHPGHHEHDILTSLGEHFFPETLEHAGHPISAAHRRFCTPLAPKDTSIKMWSSEPCRPFHYQNDQKNKNGELWVTIPLRNEDIFTKLLAIRQLRPAEASAIQELYFMPRAALSPFALLFSNFGEAVERLVQEHDEKERFNYFRRQVLIFKRRCEIISDHLATHVRSVVDSDICRCCHLCKGGHSKCTCSHASCHKHDNHLAWTILKSLVADENTACAVENTKDGSSNTLSEHTSRESILTPNSSSQTASGSSQKQPAPAAKSDLQGKHSLASGPSPWEDDSGKPPSHFIWESHFSGSALAALLGLIGVGLKGEWESQSGQHWNEIRGGLRAFGPAKNEWNAPLPTVIPDFSISVTAAQDKFVSFKNGFSLRDHDNKILGGAESFKCKWNGSLLVDKPGRYVFSAGRKAEDGRRPAHDSCDAAAWKVSLRRGQKTYKVLEHHQNHGKEHSFESQDLHLHHGVYEIEVTFSDKVDFDHPPEAHREHTGFEIKYEGPDTESKCIVVPIHNLMINYKNGPLDWSEEVGCFKNKYLREEYYSTFRDIRRTYQRAFKAFLFARQFCLSAEEDDCDKISEIEYLLENAHQFQGTSYYQTKATEGPVTYLPHHAWFDFNFLPVGDPYHSLRRAEDSRCAPSEKRKAALFDWWERMFDYVHLRNEIRQVSRRPLWRTFLEASSDGQYADLDNILRHFRIDPSLRAVVLNYYDATNSTISSISAVDLQDERWSIRVWHARQYIRHILESFQTEEIEASRPALWASDNLEANIAIKAVNSPQPDSGIKNLVHFVQYTIFDSTKCSERLIDLQRLNDNLREHARKALLAYLCQMNRVKLPSGDFAKNHRDLSELLLQDVEVGLHKKTTRIQDGISCVQKFVQRSRLGLEDDFLTTEDFGSKWDCGFAGFDIWVVKERRKIYAENWVQWDELNALESVEATKFLKEEIPQGAQNLFAPGRSLWFPAAPPPKTPGLGFIQSKEMATLNTHEASTLERFPLLGTPEKSATPSLLVVPTTSSNGGGRDRLHDALVENRSISAGAEELSSIAKSSFGYLPMWIEAAIRLGSRFVRVAAASLPPAIPYSAGKVYCNDCGKEHIPCVDEYYFWMQDSTAYDSSDVKQEADLGTTSIDDPTAPAWNDPTQLPELLYWKKEPLLLLFWTRVHAGQLLPPRRSKEGVRVDHLGTTPFLQVLGRNLDSLFFTVTGTQGKSPSGNTPLGTDQGFRYDIVTDSAIVTPQAVPDTYPTPSYPASLVSYPWFAYFKPGKPLAPTTPFGTCLALGAGLRAKCQYQSAINWYRNAFDPNQRDNTWSQSADFEDSDVSEIHDSKKSTSPNQESLRGRDYLRDSPCASSITTNPATVRSRAVFLEYLETMLMWADSLAENCSPEQSQKALVLLETMDKLLGSVPDTVEAHPQDYLMKMTVTQFIASSPPLNPRLLKLYDEVAERLSQLRDRNTWEMAGSCSECSTFILKVPPGYSHWNRQIGESISSPCLCSTSPCQPYRFTSIFPKAVELAALTKSLATSLISAYERGDGEYLGALRAAHDRTILDLGIETAQLQWRAADWDSQALAQSMQSALTKLRYYKGLIEAGLISPEQAHITGIETATATSAGSNISDGLAEIFNLIPDISTGVAGEGPLLATSMPIGVKMAKAASTAAKILRTVADISRDTAGLSLTQAGWVRRLQEWLFQVDITTIEIAQIKRQQLASARRCDAAVRELNNHQRSVEHANEVLDFMRDKTSKHAMYLFLQKETSTLLQRMFTLALRTAQDAYAAFLFERFPTSPQPFPSLSSLWEGGNDPAYQGFMAGDKLDLALKQLERSYMSNNCRELELNKRISLRQSFPCAFINLRQHGRCEVDLDETFFDADYPGHYMRRIKSVSLSVPCVSGIYTGIHSKLRLLRSKIRTLPLIAPRQKDCCNKKHKDSAHCCCSCSTSVMAREKDPYILHRLGTSEVVATSHGQDDGGLFELTMHDERYLPFEFEGAISTWSIELPAQHNLFDFASLSDVVLNINYTAREGGANLRMEAEHRLREQRENITWRGFEIRREFPDQWGCFEGLIDHDVCECDECMDRRRHQAGYHEYQGHHEHCACNEHNGHNEHHDHNEQHETLEENQKTHHDHDPTQCHCHENSPKRPLFRQGHFDFPVRLRRGMFPYMVGRPAVRINTLCISLSLPKNALQPHTKEALDTCICAGGPCAGRHFPVFFIPAGASQRSCDPDWRTTVCVEQPGNTADGCNTVFACEIGDLNLGPVDEKRGQCHDNDFLGVLRFPRRIGRVDEAWLLCGFKPAGKCEGDNSHQYKNDGCCDKVGRKPDSPPGSGKPQGSAKARYFMEES
jgi:receptor-binding and translocation channel-forming TcA subunit of Tc toxin/ABC toxin-like protein